MERCFIFHYDISIPGDFEKHDGISMHDIMCDHDGDECYAYFDEEPMPDEELQVCFDDGCVFNVKLHELEPINNR